jgi:hypothetical protein
VIPRDLSLALILTAATIGTNCPAKAAHDVLYQNQNWTVLRENGNCNVGNRGSPGNVLFLIYPSETARIWGVGKVGLSYTYRVDNNPMSASIETTPIDRRAESIELQQDAVRAMTGGTYLTVVVQAGDGRGQIVLDFAIAGFSEALDAMMRQCR